LAEGPIDKRKRSQGEENKKEVEGKGRGPNQGEPDRQEIIKERFRHLKVVYLEEGAPILVKDSECAQARESLIRVQSGGNAVPFIKPETQGKQKDEAEKEKRRSRGKFIYCFRFGRGMRQRAVEAKESRSIKEKTRPKGIGLIGLGEEILAQDRQQERHWYPGFIGIKEGGMGCVLAHLSFSAGELVTDVLHIHINTV